MSGSGIFRTTTTWDPITGTLAFQCVEIDERDLYQRPAIDGQAHDITDMASSGRPAIGGAIALLASRDRARIANPEDATDERCND